MKKLILICFVILVISVISAVRINEIEMNPEDGRYGTEWVELYNDENEDIDISGWEIWEGISGSSGSKKILSIPEGTIIEEEGYYVVELSSAVLNNKGDFVILYDNEGNEIDKTETLKDSDWSLETWQWCEGWEFLEATKGKKNNCENEEEPEEVVEKETVEDIIEEKPKPELEELKVVSSRGITTEVIKLEPLKTKDIKSEEDKKVLDKTGYAKYGFIAFCILIGVLLILKNKRKQKNEIV